MDRSAEDVTAATSHVAYELMQLVDAALYVYRHPGGGYLKNACLESMLLHARNLVDFLVRKRSDSTDLHRDEFVGTWSPSSTESVSRLLDILPVVNKHLAHLTWQRVDHGEQEWRYPEIVDDLLGVFGAFVAEAKAQNAPGAGSFDLALAAAVTRLAATPVEASSLSATTSSTQHVEVTSFFPE